MVKPKNAGRWVNEMSYYVRGTLWRQNLRSPQSKTDQLLGTDNLQILKIRRIA